MSNMFKNVMTKYVLNWVPKGLKQFTPILYVYCVILFVNLAKEAFDQGDESQAKRRCYVILCLGVCVHPKLKVFPLRSYFSNLYCFRVIVTSSVVYYKTTAWQ